MTDSDLHEELRAKRRRNRELRLEAVKEWARYVKAEPVDVWGPQQNRLIDSQLESARNSGIDVAHRLRIEQATDDRNED